MRKSWDEHHMRSAEHQSEMCTCAAGREVGAVFVRDKRTLVTGFNGVPSGFPHPMVCKRRELGIPSGEKLELCGCAHAEANGIANAAREGVSLKGAQLYCTHKPCTICMGLLANVGITEVYYKETYPGHTLADEIAEKANIHLFRMVDFHGKLVVELED